MSIRTLQLVLYHGPRSGSLLQQRRARYAMWHPYTSYSPCLNAHSCLFPSLHSPSPDNEQAHAQRGHSTTEAQRWYVTTTSSIQQSSSYRRANEGCNRNMQKAKTSSNTARADKIIVKLCFAILNAPLAATHPSSDGSSVRLKKAPAAVLITAP